MLSNNGGRSVCESNIKGRLVVNKGGKIMTQEKVTCAICGNPIDEENKSLSYVICKDCHSIFFQKQRTINIDGHTTLKVTFNGTSWEVTGAYNYKSKTSVPLSFFEDKTLPEALVFLQELHQAWRVVCYNCGRLIDRNGISVHTYDGKAYCWECKEVAK